MCFTFELTTLVTCMTKNYLTSHSIVLVITCSTVCKITDLPECFTGLYKISSPLTIAFCIFGIPLL